MSLIDLVEADDRDDYIEAQVHGPSNWSGMWRAGPRPEHRGTAVEAAAHSLPCPVEWHPGFRLAVDELRRYPDYRGQEYVELGAEIAIGGLPGPRVIGDAARTGRYDQQALKRFWHHVARFGAPG